MLFIARTNVDVLDAHVQKLELGALVLVVQPAAVSALDFLVGTVLLWTMQCSALALYKGQSLAIRIACALQPWWGYLVSEYGHSIYHCLGEVVGSLRHVV